MMARVPVVVPTTPGVKTMVTVHELLAANELPQVLPVIAYAAGLVAMLSSVTAEEASLVKVTVCAALAVPTATDGLKEMELGLTFNGATAVPVTVEDCGSPAPV